MSGCTITAAQMGSGVKYVTVQQLYYGNSISVEDAPRANLSMVDIEKYCLVPGDILLGKSSVKLEGIGYPAWYEGFNEPVTFSNFTTRIRARNEVNQKYLFYWLRGERARRWVKAHAQHSALTNINQSIINAIPISYPKESVWQQSIVDILSTIDQAIERTEALIAKYQQIKSGLMHDLFTRGVTDDGKLRLHHEQAPELYQETPIGWIPKVWGCRPLEHLLASTANNLRSGPFGSALLKSELVEDGIPFLGIDNIFVERFEANFKRYVSNKKFLELNRYAVRPRDVVITIMGTVGRCCVLPEDIGDALSSKHLWTMTLDQSQVIPELVCWQLNHAPWVLSWFRRQSQGAVMDAIQSSTLRRLLLPVPTMGEQEAILSKYNTCTDKLRSEISHLRKLEQQKSGLMYDLLTGKVRVPLDTPAPEAAHV